MHNLFVVYFDCLLFVVCFYASVGRRGGGPRGRSARSRSVAAVGRRGGGRSPRRLGTAAIGRHSRSVGADGRLGRGRSAHWVGAEAVGRRGHGMV